MQLVTGAHSILYSRDAEADRQFLKSVFRFPSVDAGGGWLIFGLPTSELAVHPSSRNSHFEFYLMCEDVATLMQDLRRQGIRCSPVRHHDWGSITKVRLPGGGALPVYEPKHPRPRPVRVSRGTTPRKKKRASRSPASHQSA
jgi:hypothetical protein